jgi:hypothetical protein
MTLSPFPHLDGGVLRVRRVTCLPMAVFTAAAVFLAAAAEGPPTQPPAATADRDVAGSATDLAGSRILVTERAEPAGESHTVTTEGVVRVEALDGGLLVEQDDGRLRLIEAERRGRVESLPAGDFPTPAKLGRTLLAELPPGFQVLTTKHYCICFDTSRDYAGWVAAVFERLREAFDTFFRRGGLELETLQRPLVVVIFADRGRYLEHARPTLGTASPDVIGYYDLMSNRVTTYDITGSDLLRGTGRGRPAAVGQAIAASPAASALVATLVHEATHQLAFNTGLHQRLAPIPVWVSEGVAMYFETPDLRSNQGWKGIGMLNQQRLARWRQAHRRDLLSRIIVDDGIFRDPATALDAYAEAWALTFFLLKTRRPQYTAYLARLAKKGPLASDSPEQRQADFQAAFGSDAESLEPLLMRYMAQQP